MKLNKTDGPIAYGMHEVRLSTKELLILEVALNELRERLYRGMANSEITQSTNALWTHNRQMAAGIHESYIGDFERDTKFILTSIGIK